MALSDKEKEKILEMFQNNVPITQISKELKIARQTIYNFLYSQGYTRDQIDQKIGEKKEDKKEEKSTTIEINPVLTKYLSDNQNIELIQQVTNVLAKVQNGIPITQDDAFIIIQFLRENFAKQDVVAEASVKQGAVKLVSKNLLGQLNQLIEEMFADALTLYFIKKEYEPHLKARKMTFQEAVRIGLEMLIFQKQPEDVQKAENESLAEVIRAIAEMKQMEIEAKTQEQMKQILLWKLIFKR